MTQRHNFWCSELHRAALEGPLWMRRPATTATGRCRPEEHHLLLTEERRWRRLFRRRHVIRCWCCGLRVVEP
jgi:hypothetical protein